MLSLPVFESLKASFPGTRITALVQPYAAEIVKGHPAVDRVELFDPHEGPWALARRMRALAPDAFLALYPRPSIALAAALAGVRTRVGTAYRWYSFLFDRRVRVHRSVCDRHEAEYNLDLVRALGASRIVEKSAFPLRNEHRRSASRFLRKNGVNPRDRIVAVHPGHKGSALNWSVRRYAEAVEQMARWHRVRVVLTGGRDEKPLLARLEGLIGDIPRGRRPVVMAGECELKELAALYEECDCFLSGSTGTMHLAAAVGTPVVSLFCPIPTATPVRWGPWSRGRSIVIMPKKLTCPDCRVGDCRDHDPMDAIPVEEVLRAVKRLGGL